jgi:hypothetical protein
MVFEYCKKVMIKLRDETCGAITVEAMITLPLLFLVLMATYEFFEVHRFKSIREKATYTIADLLSRETDAPGYVDDTYLDNTLRLFDDISNDNGINQLRISVIRFSSGSNDYEIRWSKIRGTGNMVELTTPDVEGATDLPNMTGGEELILVEGRSIYLPIFNMGFGSSIPISTRTFTSLRTLTKLCFANSANVVCQ